MVSLNAGVGGVAEIALWRYDMGQMGSQMTSWKTSQRRLQPPPPSQRKRQVLRQLERQESLEEIC